MFANRYRITSLGQTASNFPVFQRLWFSDAQLFLFIFCKVPPLGLRLFALKHAALRCQSFSLACSRATPHTVFSYQFHTALTLTACNLFSHPFWRSLHLRSSVFLLFRGNSLLLFLRNSHLLLPSGIECTLQPLQCNGQLQIQGTHPLLLSWEEAPHTMGP